MVNSVYWKTIKTKVARREGKWVNSVNWKIISLTGGSVPGAFKLDLLQPVEPILFRFFFNF